MEIKPCTMCMHGVRMGGVFRILVPANIETGKQLSYPMFGTYATTYSEDYQYYTFDKLLQATIQWVYKP